jgi:hypothetical protein
MILLLANFLGKEYMPPGREAVRGHLLDMNFKGYKEKSVKELLDDADVFGIALFGDGATVKKLPLINILGSTALRPNVVLEIHNCFHHMAMGGKKDARYIAKLFRPHLQQLDPNKELTDIVFFDGASNVQLGGKLLAVSYPRISVCHGGEHVVSLFFADLASFPPVKKLIVKYIRLYRMFGSGSRHAPYAMFMKNSTNFNNGRPIGLVRAAATRMAGFFYGFHRLLRLKQPLEATITSVQFRDLKLGKNDRVSEIIKDDIFWKRIMRIVKSVLPCLKILRLADRNKAGMDQLYFHVRCADEKIKHAAAFIDEGDLWGFKENTALEVLSEDDYSAKGPNITDLYAIEGDSDDSSDEENDKNDNDAEVEDEESNDESDDSDSSGSDSDEESVSPRNKKNDNSNVDPAKSMGEKIGAIWKRRRTNLTHDFAVAGTYFRFRHTYANIFTNH